MGTLTLGIIILLGFAGVFVCMCWVNLAIYLCHGGARLKDSPVIRSCSCVCCVGCVTDLLTDCCKIPSKLCAVCSLCGLAVAATKNSETRDCHDIELGDVPRTALVNVPSNTDTNTAMSTHHYAEVAAKEGPHSMTSQRQRGPLSPPLDSTSSTAMTKLNCAESTNKDRKALPPPPPRRESIDTTTGQIQTGPLSPSLNSISRSSNMAEFDILSPIAEESGEEQPLCASLEEVELVVDHQSSSESPHAANSHFVFLADSADEEQENPHVH